MVRDRMSIIEEIASQTIQSGGDAVEVEYKDDYKEVFPASQDELELASASG